MDTPLTGTLSKWITDEPLVGGDLAHNHGAYDKAPDYDQDYWLQPALFAEILTLVEASSKAGIKNQAFLYGSASSGFRAWQRARDFPEPVLNHSLSVGADHDYKHFTAVRLIDALERNVFLNDILLPNYRDQAIAAKQAVRNLRDPQTGAHNFYVYSPFHRQGAVRVYGESFALSRNIQFEDAVWEKHLWIPRALHNETTYGILHGDHAWSINKAVEASIGLNIRYGSSLLLDIRRGQNYAMVDIMGRPVSPVDEAWEDARHLVYELTRPLIFDGHEYEVRSERPAALLLSRFMHDDWRRNNISRADCGLDHDLAHDDIKAFYADPAQLERMDRLKELMIPFMAEYCEWPSLNRILKNDPDLAAYWEDNVVNTHLPLIDINRLKTEILAYVPRAGLNNTALARYVEESRDPSVMQFAFSGASFSSSAMSGEKGAHRGSPKGVQDNPFKPEFNPCLFDDGCFARLNGGKPGDKPDPDHYSYAQAVALATVMGRRNNGELGDEIARRLVYLDDPSGGLRGAAFMYETGILDERELATNFDSASDAGEKYSEKYGAENAADYATRRRRLLLSREYEPFRQQQQTQIIDSISDVKADIDRFKSRRDSYNTAYDRAFNARGSHEIPSLAGETVLRKIIASESHGVILPHGRLTGLQAGALSEGLTVVTGMNNRDYTGDEYDFKFIMDYFDPAHPEYLDDLHIMDLADLIIHIGIQVKAMLEQPNPPRNSAHYVLMARLLDVYERLLDPGRRNMLSERSAFVGHDQQQKIIDFDQVDPTFKGFVSHHALQTHAQDLLADHRIFTANPALQAFMNDPDYQNFACAESDKPDNYYARFTEDHISKMKLVEHIWGWMRAAPIHTEYGMWPVTGNLAFRAIRDFNYFQLSDIAPEYGASYRAWHNLNEKQRKVILKQGHVHIRAPGVDIR